MHLLSTRPGGHVEDGGQGVVRVEQTRGDIVVLSAADTTLSLLADAAQQLPEGFPTVRLANLMWLRQPASADMYVDDVLQHARVVVIDHLGAASDWAYVVERVRELARERGQWLALFSGDASEDLQLLLRSTAPHEDCRQLWRCLREGGRDNARGFFDLIGHSAFGLGARPTPPTVLPAAMVYESLGAQAWQDDAPVALLVFYRAHVQAGNTAVFDAMRAALHGQGLNTVAVAVDSLKNPTSLALLQSLAAQHGVGVVLNATSFAITALDGGDSDGLDGPPLQPLAGDAPVLQLITAGCAQEQWAADPHGLAPRDLAMQVVLPEVDGRIGTRAISFKGLAWRCERTEVDVVRYQPEPERMAFVAELARRWCVLRDKPNAHKRVALILANYPNDDSRLANGVGLDTPASTVALLHAMQGAGYATGALPEGSDALMAALVAGVTNNLDANDMRPASQSLAMADYLADFNRLDAANRDAVNTLWGQPEQDPMVRSGRFMVSGHRYGHVFVGNQPARGRDLDLVATYHDADLVPTHNYLAFYFWLRRQFAVDAVVHVGKHGNLEWLPGKSVALGANCWPDAILGPLPHLYPFIVNDPGEGSQAKRRTQAVIIDHLMPALTRAETYGPLQKLERQMDEYYEALSLDPRRAQRLRGDILDRVLTENLHTDLGFAKPADDAGREALLQRLDAYLCEIKESQIRDGLHILGTSPQGRQQIDTLVALARFPGGTAAGQRSLLVALAKDLQLDGVDGFNALSPEWAAPWSGPHPAVLQAQSDDAWRHAGHTRERLELLARQLVTDHVVGDDALDAVAWPHTAPVLQRMQAVLRPRLDACGPQEILQCLRGLSGKFVPAGPSGAPSRGRPDVLPTGRNFYSVDTRAVPTQTAYAMGAAAAERVIERHLQDHGCMPGQVGLSVWGTSTMRTGGEDIAQAFALLGVRPKWADGSSRVVDIEVLPMGLKGRPRVDVTLRVSGFFRDAFPNVIDLFDTAVRTVAAISEEDEPDEVNPIRARVRREAADAQAKGLSTEAAEREATWRVFGPRPGGYGAGLQELMASGRWNDGADLAQAYLRAGAFAYGQGEHGVAARGSFEQRIAGLDAVLHNQDNREHDVLDSDDYYQFQGGMAVAVEALTGEPAALYHGDFSVPGAPRIRTLGEEVARVVRSRAVNPKWLEGVRRHGYKGAFEMAATVDYLFAFDATTGVVGDHQYALVADAYLHDDTNRAFLQQHNPGALRSIGERLLEAMQRGLWEAPGDQRERIEDHLLALERRVEEHGEGPLP
ncbi:MAG: cobaltochelatase subunit CobN [Curvibacter sp. RIFCSPHIGHO2_12_FULL_63_18]|uniref:cobaltochelatase subunit CobN n=1 Tax=Rhodoferax sp. TaxID=50421 RepID=UPI0008B353E1|nr:cobaltochelatase subunit CobN [Rhodoferax sp.]OGO97001.1 MAG: cobaltochelatase subunit CobN [Curvibacter sp. GWA2_63_95]OGP01178.1 MAG: cobaltochelatase subunit CobN [Curvibacter sp. RIFCSPHIGHO2_12_FULL_63_18]HCX79992.1 cobaltochelatase subunit CobN [Rhodoferax sp.]